MVKKTVSISSFIFKHFVASVVSIVIPSILVVVAYFVLFVIAIFTNSGLGSPIALPLWIIIVFVVTTLYTTFLLFPSVLLAEITSRIFRKWQHIAQIPISTFVLAVLVFTASSMVHIDPDYSAKSFLHWANYPLIIFLGLTIPLGIYWWTMKIVQTGISIPIVLFKRSRKAKDSEVQ